MTTIDRHALVTVTGGSLASTTNPSLLDPRLPRPLPQQPQQPQPQKPAWPNLPGFDPRFPPGSLDLPRRNDIA